MLLSSHDSFFPDSSDCRSRFHEELTASIGAQAFCTVEHALVCYRSAGQCIDKTIRRNSIPLYFPHAGLETYENEISKHRRFIMTTHLGLALDQGRELSKF